MIDDDEIVETPAADSAGQIGGPSAEEQQRVDEEQRQLIARIRAERAPLEEEETRIRDEARDRELGARAERREISEMVKNLKERVEALEARR